MNARPPLRPFAAALLLPLAPVLIQPSGAAAMPNPVGPEFQVNTYTTGFQRLPVVAVGSSGHFVVAWDGDGPGLDGGFGAFAQRFSIDGNPIGGNFLVASYTTGGQAIPAIASTPESGFIVTWYSFGSPGSDQDGASIHARRFSPAGTALGPQFQVNSLTTGYQYVSDIAVSGGDGSFVLTWQSEASAGTDNHATSIQARRFSSTGTPQGSEFQVNTYTPFHQLTPKVASHSNGSFVVVWESFGAGPSGDSYYPILAQRFSSSGAPVGSEFLANSLTTGIQVSPDVAALPDGGFVVVWSSDVSAGTDTSSSSIQARRFDSSGSPLGPEVQVNSYTTGIQAVPSVASTADGSFIVVWESAGSSGNDTDSRSIQARVFSAAGLALGTEFQVNTYTTQSQQFSSIAADPSGNLILAWDSLGSDGTDTDGFSVHARVFDQLFRDGFESGDTSRWSLNVGEN